MRKILASLIVVALAGGWSAVARGDCSCAEAKRNNDWCKTCRVGYVAAVPIKSWMFFETVHAHGHAIQPETFRCATCILALEHDGFCDRCRMGFVKKKVYLSRLAYYVAKGKLRDPTRIGCGTCRKNARTYGWCGTCRIGMVGPIALRDRADLKVAHEALRRLRDAIHLLDSCETCAVAMFSGGRCPLCRLSWQNGKGVPIRKRNVSRSP